MFQEAVRNLNLELDGLEKDGEVYQKLTHNAAENHKVTKVVYTLDKTFSTSGGGGKGYQKQNVTVRFGRSSEKTVSHAAMARVKATQAWVAGGQPGMIEGEGQYDFS